MKLSDINDNMRRCMSKSARLAIGAHGLTAEEASAKWAAKSEKQLQQQIVALLRLRGIWFDCDAMHVKRTGTKGAPDFLLALNGQAVAIEAKFAKGLLSDDQEKAHCAMRLNGWRVHVVRSLDEVRAILDRLTP